MLLGGGLRFPLYSRKTVSFFKVIRRDLNYQLKHELHITENWKHLPQRHLQTSAKSAQHFRVPVMDQRHSDLCKDVRGGKTIKCLHWCAGWCSADVSHVNTASSARGPVAPALPVLLSPPLKRPFADAREWMSPWWFPVHMSSGQLSYFCRLMTRKNI